MGSGRVVVGTIVLAFVGVTFLAPAGSAQLLDPYPVYGYRLEPGDDYRACLAMYFYFGSYSYRSGLWEELRWCRTPVLDPCEIRAWQVYQYDGWPRHWYDVACIGNGVTNGCFVNYGGYCWVRNPVR